MKITGKYPEGPGSVSEQRVYNLLANASQADWIALYGVYTPGQHGQQNKESDFIVLVPGVGGFVIEVKGCAQVEVDPRSGCWRSINGSHQYEKKVSPLQQARGAVNSLMQHLKGIPSLANLSQELPWFYECVVFTQMGRESVKQAFPDFRADDSKLFCLDPNTTSLTLTNWLLYVAKTHGRYDQSEFSAERAGRIQRALSPESVSLDLNLIGAYRANVVGHYTEEQRQVLHAYFENGRIRVLLLGPAGTGKTVMALALAKDYIADGQNVVFVAKSPVLCAHIENKIKTWNSRKIFFATSRQLSSVPERWADVLIVDEVQDVLSQETLPQLDRILKAGLSRGAWVFAGDPENQSFHPVNVAAELTKYLGTADYQIHPLMKNMRNPRKIGMPATAFLTSGKILDVIDGPLDGMAPSISFPTEHENLEAHIIKMANSLWTDAKEREWTFVVVADRPLTGVDTLPCPCHTVAEFKGVEADMVLAVISDRSIGKPELYVMATRAKSRIHWIVAGIDEYELILNDYQKISRTMRS